MARTRTAAALLLTLVAAGCGCISDASFAQRVKDHVNEMKPVYEQGVVTFPGATDDDREIYRRHMTQLDRLLDAGGAK